MPMWGRIPQGKPKHIRLHQRLGIPLNQPIPERVLRSIIATRIGGVISPTGYMGGGAVLVDTQLKYQANYCLNVGQSQGSGF